MGQAVTYAVEIGVGVACLAGAAGLARGRRRRWLAAVLAVAGLAAVVHGAVALAG